MVEGSNGRVDRGLTEYIDHYATLGVAPDSDQAVIRAAYRALMLKYHPDTNKSAGATNKAKQINAAYAVLGNPAKRAAYDRRWSIYGEPSRQQPTEPETTKEAPKPNRWEGFEKRRQLVLVVMLGSMLTYMVFDKLTGFSAQPPENASTAAPPDDAVFGFPTASSGPATGVSIPHEVTPLDPAALESGVRDLDEQLVGNDVAGATSWSQACHHAVANGVSWSDADRCAAFDLAARYYYVDHMPRLGWPPEPYFQFQDGELAAYYRGLTADEAGVADRLKRMRSTVEPLTRRMVAEAVARRGGTGDK